VLQKFVKTDNQPLKHKVNRCVCVSLRLNACKLSASRTAAGRMTNYSSSDTLLIRS